MATPLILASASSARALVLSGAGLAFERRPAHLDEDAVKARARAEGWSVARTAGELARAKALAVAAERPDALVIGADQILDCDGAWFDKPADRAAAAGHLRRLRGRTHALHSAVCAAADGAVTWDHLDTARLTMRDFSDAFLDGYLAAGGAEILESVGAYRLEGPGAQLFDHIDGDYFTILGLPLLPLLAFLRERGILPA